MKVEFDIQERHTILPCCVFNCLGYVTLYKINLMECMNFYSIFKVHLSYIIA